MFFAFLAVISGVFQSAARAGSVWPQSLNFPALCFSRKTVCQLG
jgi:hypothetical protein